MSFGAALVYTWEGAGKPGVPSTVTYLETPPRTEQGFLHQILRVVSDRERAAHVARGKPQVPKRDARPPVDRLDNELHRLAHLVPRVRPWHS
jgi:hypothetical protein